MTSLKTILAQLISYQSITPEDVGCQAFMMEFLHNLGFACQQMDKGPVANFYASYGTSGPLLVFAGHTDVVPVGDAKRWNTDPFCLSEQEGMWYGRGVADMKGSLASMLVMAERFVTTYPHMQGRLGFLITSGEEGEEYHLGTPHVMERLEQQGIHIDYCVVGEPSSTQQVGDVIKIGRRGSLNAQIIVNGKQGHVAYPHLAENPIHSLSPVLAELTAMKWDEGNAFFPPTSMQITYLHSGGHASNIIPGDLELHLNFRYSTQQTAQGLEEQVRSVFLKHHVTPLIQWRLSGEPFLTDKGLLVEYSKQVIQEITDCTPELSTSGGTSDGRFIAPFGVEVVEIGPVNATIHQVNECVAENDLNLLEKIYFSLAERLLVKRD